MSVRASELAGMLARHGADDRREQAARDDAEFYAETLAFLARLDAHRAEQIRALHAFGEAIAAVARSRWCPECRGTRSVIVAGVEEDCDRCDALGVVAGEAGKR